MPDSSKGLITFTVGILIVAVIVAAILSGGGVALTGSESDVTHEAIPGKSEYETTLIAGKLDAMTSAISILQRHVSALKEVADDTHLDLAELRVIVLGHRNSDPDSGPSDRHGEH